jgi:hypothetical protein
MPRTLSIFAWFLSALLTVTPTLDGCNKSSGQQPTQTSTSAPANAQAPAATSAKPSADELYQLVAPIALFPDNLVAQVLAASTYPDQVSSANTWLKQNAKLKGNDLMQAVDKQPWDVSVKGLTQFPDVLNQMASNLSWTSALGDAYFNIPQDVMNAVQVMRQRASQAGNLKSNEQQKVTTETPAPPQKQATSSPQPTVVQAPPQTIIIQPAQPQVVYVPTYNPTVVYGAPVVVYPGYVPPPPPSTGELVATGLISFGIGMAVGAAMSGGCCGWGWNSWGCGWHSSTVIYNHNTYISNSNTFVNRNNYYNRNVNNVNRNNINTNNVNRNNINNNNYRANNFSNTTRNSNFTTPNFGTEHNQQQYRNTNYGGGQQLGQAQNRPQMNQQNRPEMAQNQSRPQVNQAQRGYGEQQRGAQSGAFSNYSQGGNARVNSARGQESLSGARAGGGRRR